jgi:para-aminobenzoate synthetase component 1
MNNNRFYIKSEAIALMNHWGKTRTPFLFIIDFEMRKTMLYRLDKPLPSSVRYDFSGIAPETGSFSKKNIPVLHKSPVPFDHYLKAYDLVMREIEAGNTFVANLTMPTPVEISATLCEIYERSQARFKLLVEDKFVCFSPEPFVRIRGGIITAFPMKGTISCSIPDAEQVILSDRKERAEHFTVVDLLRNDLSMVAKNVSVKKYRYLDRIVTHEGEILQVSSEISGKLEPGYHSHIGDILFTLLPAGSVTGAPKHKTTAIIREAEQADRGYYTGICGICNGEGLESAVMIRFIELWDGAMVFRSGGGITFLSHARTEYEEMISKVYVPVA